MRKLILVLLLVLPAISSAQIPKKASTVIAETIMPAKDNYDYILSELFDMEIMIDRKDSSNYYIVTEPLKLPNGIQSGTYRIKFVSRDNKITTTFESKLGLTLELYGVQSTDDWQMVRYEGIGKSHPYKLIFHQWSDFMREFSTRVYYQ